MPLDELTRDRQSEAAAFALCLGRVDRLEDPFLRVARDARARVDDLDQHVRAGPPDAHLEPPAVLHRLQRVVHEVRPHPVQLFVARAHDTRVAERAHELDAVFDLALIEREHGLDVLRERGLGRLSADRPRVGLALGREDELRSTVGGPAADK